MLWSFKCFVATNIITESSTRGSSIGVVPKGVACERPRKSCPHSNWPNSITASRSCVSSPRQVDRLSSLGFRLWFSNTITQEDRFLRAGPVCHTDRVTLDIFTAVTRMGTLPPRLIQSFTEFNFWTKRMSRCQSLCLVCSDVRPKKFPLALHIIFYGPKNKPPIVPVQQLNPMALSTQEYPSA